MKGRIAIALAAALAAGLLAAGRPVGPRLRRAVGGDVEPHLVFQVDPGEHEVGELAPIWHARMPGYGLGIQPDPPLLRVTVYGARPADSYDVHAALIRRGVLEFYAVLEDAPVMRDAFQAAQQGRWPEVTGEVDGWRHDETGKSFTDYFLMSNSPVKLQAAIADLPLEPGMRIGLEFIDIPGSEQEPFYRTYLLTGEPMLSNQHIERASLIFDPQTNRPEVLIEFNDDGTRRFAEGTRRLVGHKMAIVLDDRVASAPVIQTEISGGRSNITMGGGDADRQLDEAQALVDVLGQHGPPLPRGLAAMVVAEYEPSSSLVWGVRLGFAAFVGLAVFLFAHVVVRRRWMEPAAGVPRARGGSVARAALAVAVSIGVPLLLWLGGRIYLPGMNLATAVPIWPNLMMLGPAPLLLAFLAVELVALVVPPLRRRRRQRAESRAGIDRAVVWVALFLAAVLAWDHVDNMRTYGEFRGIASFPGALGRWTAMVSLVGGAMLYLVGARVIARWGAGNPWAILIAGHALVLLARLRADARWYDEARPTVLAVALIAALVTIALTRHRVGGRRAPGAGLAPLFVLPVLLHLRGLPFVRDLDRHGTILRHLDGVAPLTELALVAILAAGLAVLGGARRPAQLAAAILPVVALAWLDHLIPYELRAGHPVLLGAALGVGVVELVSGALRHARLRAAVPLFVHHDLDRLDEHAAALTAAGIPVAVEGAATRAIARGFGAFAPIVLRVPASAEAQARAIPSTLGDPLTTRAAEVFD
jgi:hypothetical protein